jgi:hypothetical protein
MSHRTITSRRRRGFALVFALVMIGLVGVGLAAMAMFFAVQARRTKALPVEAQEQQLLLAGASAVLAKMQEAGGGAALAEWEIPLPREAGAAKLVCRPPEHADTAAMVWTIEATVNGQTARQVVRLVRVEGRWKIEAATLRRP